MKKILTLLSLAIISIGANAQNSLAGSWAMTEKVMFFSITQMMTFDSSLSGKVENKFSLIFNANFMGVKMSGEAETSISGVFELKGDRLTIKWGDDVRQKIVKPIEISYKDEVAPPDIQKKMENLWDECAKAFKEMAGEEVIYDSAVIKNGKLILSRIEDGKKNNLTYKFVSGL